VDKPPVTHLNTLFACDKDQFRHALCAIVAKHGGRYPRMFGPVHSTTDEQPAQLNLLVDPTPKMRLLDLGYMYQELSALLNLVVDIWTPEELPLWLKEDVLAECVALCDDPAIT
jgi:predicted nucleotidyltransferase